MKWSLINLVKSPFLFAMVTLLVAGCTHTIRLEVVDATSGQPLAGVSTLWREDSAYNLLTGSRLQMAPTNLPASSGSGIITINGVHKNWFSRFVFDRDGYTTIYGIYSQDTLEFAQRIKPSPLPQERFILEDPRSYSPFTNGCFLIPLPK
jgi:hypothetical protein